MEKITVLPPARLFYSVLWFSAHDVCFALGVLAVKPWEGEGAVQFSHRELARISDPAERRAAHAWVVACERQIPCSYQALDHLGTTAPPFLTVTRPTATRGNLDSLLAMKYRLYVERPHRRINLYRFFHLPELLPEEGKAPEPIG